MRVAILDCGAIVVREKDHSWLFGAPVNIREALDAAGIDVPPVVFTTTLRAPGFGNLGQVMRLKEAPLRMDGLTAKPIPHSDGADYLIEADNVKILFSERGSVSVKDVEGCDLAIIKNKHRADKFGDHVITWPWPNAEYVVQDGVATRLDEAQLKVWSSMEDVPANLKKIDDTALSLEQANFLARVAKASGEDGEENWAIAHTQFKKSYAKEGDHWVKKEPESKEKEDSPEANEEAQDGTSDTQAKEYAGDRPIPRILDILTAALHKAYNDTSDKLFGVGYLNQDERLKIAQSIGEGLDAFRKAVEGESFATRAVDKWDADNLWQTKEKTWTHVYKSDKTNDWRWAAITSVATWDRQGEFVSTKAMDWAVGFAKLTGFKGPLRYKHIPGLDGGQCDTQLRVGDYLFESGTFDNSQIGLAMRAKLKDNPETWQISPGLAFAKGDLVNGVYKRAAIFERSMTQRPANPFTIILHKSQDGEPDMKIMTEAELKQAASELGMEFEEVKMMYERALAAGSGPMGLKEFKEVVEKATGTNGSGFPGGANSSHQNRQEEEGETEMLKEAIESLDEAELKALAELTFQTMKEKGKKMSKADMDAMMEGMSDEEHEAMEEDKMEKSKKKEDDPATSEIDALKQLVTEQTRLLQEQTKALGSLTQALATGNSQEALEGAVAKLFNAAPRRQAPQFVSQRTKSAGELPDDNAVLDKLTALEEQLKQFSGKANPGQAIYDAFTSQKLNQPKNQRGY